MLSLKLVMLALIPISAAILSVSAWYQWSPQVSQLNVPVGPGVADAPAPADAPEAAEALAAAAAALGVDGPPVTPHAARNAPSPVVAPTAPASFRNSRRWSRLVNSSI